MGSFLGAWKLLFINVTNGTAIAYGPNPLGRIIFAESGYMNAMVTNPDVAKPLPNGTLWQSGTDAQLATIARPMVSYSGPYHLENRSGELYTHVNVEIAMDPSMVGTEQIRHAKLGEREGKDLLSLIPVVTGVDSTSTLVWEKIPVPTR